MSETHSRHTVKLEIYTLNRKAFYPAPKIILCPRPMIWDHGSISSRKSRKVAGEVIWQLIWPLHHLFFSYTNPWFHLPCLSYGFPYDSLPELCSLSPFSVPSCHFIEGIPISPTHMHSTITWWDLTQLDQSEFFSNIVTESRRKKSVLCFGIMRYKDQLSLELHQPIFPPARESPLEEEVNTKGRRAEMEKDGCLLVNPAGLKTSPTSQLPL